MVIGAGHAGLAVSACLSEKSIEHVLLERGEVANSWRNERWDSLTLLTPNWQSRLPGYAYEGDDPDGFMDMPSLIGFIDRYAREIGAPVRTQTTVQSVTVHDGGYRIETDREAWHARTVVIASGACNLPEVPRVTAELPEDIFQLTARDYRNTDQLPPGGVLIVGASASGLQLAEEIRASGRDVCIAVGEHVRLPRRYRGRDIQWWMHHSGLLDEGIDVVDDLRRVRQLPSPQLTGDRQHQIFDLNHMSGQGIRLFGRLMGVRDSTALFSGSLKNVCALADLKMKRLLNQLDDWAEETPGAGPFEPVERFPDTRVDEAPTLSLDLANTGIETVLWATGFRPDYSWLDVPVMDRWGLLKHDCGVVESPGMYLVGMPFMRLRKSSFIHGAEDDARHVTDHLAGYLNH
ncbi:MAG: NAD(P)-binding domain-containing protein [Xanthomonadales bacterium]|nr:NAD(P)-binding domain-containing protein [Xanthomonadales bacterium]